MKYPFFKQEKDWYCGPAVIKSVLAAYNIVVSQESVARELGTSARGGTDREDLAKPLLARNFVVETKTEATLAQMRKRLLDGWTLVVNYIEPSEDICHFAIVIRVTETRVYMVDPWNGPRFSISAKDFVSRWYGCAPNLHEQWYLAAKLPVKT